MNHFDLTQGLMWYFVFVYSTVCHEAGHAWAALKLGDATAYEGGQVSLDPVPHIRREPFGMVAVPILTYLLGGWMLGWARAPYDADWAERFPRKAGWMALAGPATNLALLLGAYLGIRVGCACGVFVPPMVIGSSHLVEAVSGRLWDLAAALLSIVFSLNLLLFTFNLVPLPPLDGSNFPLLFLGHDAALEFRRVMWSPGMRFFGLLVAFRGFGYLYPFVERAALNLIYPGIHYS